MNSSFRGHGIWLLRSSGKNLHFWSSQWAQYYRFYTFCDGSLFLRFSSFKPLILRIWQFSCHSHSRAWGTKGSDVIDDQAIHAKTMDTSLEWGYPLRSHYQNFPSFQRQTLLLSRKITYRVAGKCRHMAGWGYSWSLEYRGSNTTLYRI